MNTKIVEEEPKVTGKVIEYGSKEHEALIAGAYGMTKANAEDILKQREANPAMVPIEKAEKAQAMLEALKSKPIPIDTAPGHFRKDNRFSQ